MKAPEYHKGDCQFCHKVAMRKFSERFRDSESKEQGFYLQFQASLVIYDKKRGDKSGMTRGRTIYESRPLNYCPECGKALKRRRKPANQT